MALLGVGTTTNSHESVQLVSGAVTAVAAGVQHTAILKNDGSVHTGGRSGVGQFGDGSTINSHESVHVVSRWLIATAADFYHAAILKNDGSVHTVDYNGYGGNYN